MKKEKNQIQYVLSKFPDKKNKSSNSYSTKCPAHNDKKPSLRITINPDRILLYCHAGCKTKDILSNVGLKMSDLFLKDTHKDVDSDMVNSLQHRNGCTLEKYSKAKKLPINFLKKLRLSNKKYGQETALKIPYYDENGSEVSIRYRTSIDGKDKFKWKSGTKIHLYGLNQLDQARRKNYIIVVEGESDCHTLWYHKIPAVGIPGAANWKEERDAKHFEGIETIYLVIEPDKGGETLFNAFKTSSLADRIKIVQFKNYKDPSDMYISMSSSKEFKNLMEKKLESAWSFNSYLEVERKKERKKLWNECMEIAKNENILKLFVNEVSRKGLTGEKALVKGLYLALTTRILKKPVSIVIKGGSSSGKSYTASEVLKFFPADAYHDFTTATEKALIYGDESFKNKFLIIFEAAGIKQGFQEYIIRTLLSEDRIKYKATVPAEDGSFTTRTIEKEGPTGLLTTTTRVSLHKENETRCISFTTDDTDKQTGNICMLIGEQENAGVTETNIDVKKWHAFQKWLSLRENRVRIPYAITMSKLVDPRALRIRRDITKIFSLIKAHAIIHQYSRKKDSDGFILASIRDYSAVYKLVSDTISSEVEASVPKTVRETVNAVENIISGNAESVTLAELAEVMKIHKSTVQRRVARAIEQGYLINEEEKQGRPAKLIIGERMPENIRILPTSKKLKQEYLKGKNLSKHSGD